MQELLFIKRKKENIKTILLDNYKSLIIKDIIIKQVLNLDASTIATRQETCDYLINNKKWVIDYKEDLFSGETQFLNLNIFF